jgi:transposase
MNNAPTGKRLPLDLTDEERASLEKLTKATLRAVALRARVLLALESGQNSPQVSGQTGLHPVAVRRIKHEFQAHRLLALQARKRTGRRPQKRQAVEAFLEQQGQRGMLQTPEGGILSVQAIRARLEKEQQVHVCINTVRNALKKRGLPTDASDIA